MKIKWQMIYIPCIWLKLLFYTIVLVYFQNNIEVLINISFGRDKKYDLFMF